MMEDDEYKDKRIKNLVTVLWLFLITYMEVVMVWGAIYFKGPKNCSLSRMNHLQVHVLVSE